MSVRSPFIAASVAVLALLASAASASAECKTMGFTVNDYGKDGPTKDAKELLDKDIAKWAADAGVDKYTVGKKTVKCELFLDVILFDEHTCTASASVCWGANLGTPPAKTAKEGAAPAKKTSTKAADSEAKAPVETGAITPEAPAKAETPAAAKTEEKPAAKPVEAAVTPPPAAAPSSSDNSDAAERAAAAAERAAAAAERAAAAAEKAAAGNHAPATADASPDASRQITPAAKP